METSMLGLDTRLTLKKREKERSSTGFKGGEWTGGPEVYQKKKGKERRGKRDGVIGVRARMKVKRRMGRKCRAIKV